MGLFDDRKRWRGVDFARLVPEKAAQEVSGDRPGQVVLLQERYGGWLLGRLLQPLLPDHKKHVRVPLEDRGSYLWALCDGRRTVGDLVAAFKSAFPADAEQADRRVAGYLYNLEKNGFLRFRNLETG